MDSQLQTQVKASVKNIRISPLKLRRVLNLIRGKNGLEILDYLRFMPHKAARIIEKVLHSALSNAENNYNLDVEDMFVSEAYADGGRVLKRIRPRAQGRAYAIRKRFSHMTIVVKTKESE